MKIKIIFTDGSEFTRLADSIYVGYEDEELVFEIFYKGETPKLILVDEVRLIDFT